MLKSSNSFPPSDCHAYAVKDTDTLERIAAIYDSTPSALIKINRLGCRMVFPGQTLFVPDCPDSIPYNCKNSSILQRTKSLDVPSNARIPNSNTGEHNKIVEEMADEANESDLETSSEDTGKGQQLLPNDNDQTQNNGDQGRLQDKASARVKVTPPISLCDPGSIRRFIKLNVKHFTENEGVVHGTLIVTPNCVMFDPDLSHPLVIENGSDRYSMKAKLDQIISAGLYKDISAMTHENPYLSQKDMIYNSDDLTKARSASDSVVELNQQGTDEVTEGRDQSVISASPARRETAPGDINITLDIRKDVPIPNHQLPEPNPMDGPKPSSPDNGVEPSIDVPLSSLVDGNDSNQSLNRIKTQQEDDGYASSPEDQAGAFLLPRYCNGNRSSSERNISSSEPKMVYERELFGKFGANEWTNHQKQIYACSVPNVVARWNDSCKEMVPASCTNFAACSMPSIVEDHEPAPLTRRRSRSLDEGIVSTTLAVSASFSRRTMKGAQQHQFVSHASLDGNSWSFAAFEDSGEGGCEAAGDESTIDPHLGEETVQANVTWSLSDPDQFRCDEERVEDVEARVDRQVNEDAQVPPEQPSDHQKLCDLETQSSTVPLPEATADTTTHLSKDVARETAESSSDASAVMDLALDKKSHEVHELHDGNSLSDVYATSPIDRIKQEIEMKRKRSFAKLEELKARTVQARSQAATLMSVAELEGTNNEPITNSEPCEQGVVLTSSGSFHFTCATSPEEGPDLTTPIERMVPSFGPPPTTEMPYFLCIRSGRLRYRKRRNKRKIDSGYDNKGKTEFWFTVPKDKANALYTFFIQWSPEKYGADTEVDDIASMQQIGQVSDDGYHGFVVLESDEEDAVLTRESSSPFGPGALSSLLPASFLNREWEIVTVEEVKRRLSLADIMDISRFPLPRGSEESEILQEEQIRQIVSILPARAEGYPWVLIYSTSQHGFSLKTLYRSMSEWDEDMSPTLLLVETTGGAVFGAVVSDPLRISDHFYGTGESLLFTFVDKFREFRWSGDNNFFIRGGMNSLSIGAGKGASGLWLDSDLYHGRTQECETFGNPPLTLADEDFLVAKVEAFGFCMEF